MKISAKLKLSTKFQNLISNLITENDLVGKTTVINFRDPDYSEESGGFQPVEIMIDAQGEVQYVTDFRYYGAGVYAELGKDLDFDFSCDVFQQMGREFPISQAKELFKMWMSNFVTYHEMEVYEIEVSEA